MNKTSFSSVCRIGSHEQPTCVTLLLTNCLYYTKQLWKLITTQIYNFSSTCISERKTFSCNTIPCNVNLAKSALQQAQDVECCRTGISTDASTTSTRRHMPAGTSHITACCPDILSGLEKESCHGIPMSRQLASVIILHHRFVVKRCL